MEPEPLRLRTALVIGVSVTAGWVLHDLAVFMDTNQPEVALELLPGSAVALIVGALLGAVFFRWRSLFALTLLASALAVVLLRGFDFDASRAQIWFPRALLLASLAWGAVFFARAAPVRAGLSAGVLACALMCVRVGLDLVYWPLVAAALVLLVAGRLRRPALRRLVTAAVVVAAIAWIGAGALRANRLTRPDLPPRASSAAGPNLVLVVLDTVRADHLAPYGYERVTTPGIDAFVREHATLFSDARSTSSWTLPSHASLFTGKLPAEHGATHPNPLAQPIRPGVTTLAERLRERGYRTGAVVANAAYLRPGLGTDRGYERFDNRGGCWVRDYLALAQLTGARLQPGHIPYRRARSITDAALRWVDSVSSAGSFFLTLNYLEAHSPYLPARRFERAFSPERPRDPLDPPAELIPLLYDRELASLDEEVTRFLRELEQRGLFDSTVVIITSDHGEALGDHGFMRHGWTLYEELVHVPLYIKPVGPRPQTLNTESTNSADVHDLALRALGIEPEPRSAPPGWMSEWYHGRGYGRKRMAEMARETGMDLQCNLVAWVEGRIKYIVSNKGKVEVYDLDRDPGELDPLGLSEGEIETARAHARAWWDEHPTQTSAAAVDDDDMQMLRGLGYVGDK